MLLRRLVLVVSLFYFCTLAFFAQAEEMHVILKAQKEKGMKVEYLGKMHGLDGWVVENDKDQVQYIYTTSEGGLIMGLLWGPDGKMSTSNQIEDYRLSRLGDKDKANKLMTSKGDKQKPVSEKVYMATEKSNWFGIGKKTAPYIYVFVNPTCSHCLDYWTNFLSKEVKKGNLQLRMIPFGNAEENKTTSAALLSSDNPEKAWAEYAAGDESVLSKDKVNKDMYKKVEENTKIWADWKLPSPPFTIYRAPADGKIKVIVGVPDNMMLLMADFIN